MTASTTDLILHALTGIRALMIAYHQMRTQAVVFIAGLAVAFASFMLSRHDEAGWVWVALLGPSVFLILALFLAMYFRQLIDCCQAIEAKLQDELQRAANTESPVPSSAAGESPSEATLKSRSAIHYRTALLQNETDIKGNKIHMRLWHDAPQKALIIYMLAYLVFWFFWFKPWKWIPKMFS